MKKIALIIATLLALLVALPLHAQEYTVESVPNVQVADRTQFVTDPDGYIDSASRTHINTLLSQLRDSNSVEAAVVMLPSIGNEDIDNFATELFTRWGIGKASNDNGLLFIAVMDQRQIVIRTGYGLEGVLPDIICSRIIREYITPAFRNGAYGEGMSQAVEQTLNIIMTPEASAELWADDAEPLFDENDKAILLSLLYSYLLFSICVSLLLSVRLNSVIHKHGDNPYECYKELNEAHTIMLITAILFPVWCLINYICYRRVMKKMRNKPRNCAQCGSPMQRLSEKEDNKYLTSQEDTEERIGSVDYDVWLCNNCHNTEIFRFDAAYTQYTECPFCHAKTFSLTRDHIVVPATTVSSGRGEKIYSCQYCKKLKSISYIIPMIITPKVSGGGGGSSFGGGFGGGMTGGGGARGGW